MFYKLLKNIIGNNKKFKSDLNVNYLVHWTVKKNEMDWQMSRWISVNVSHEVYKFVFYIKKVL